MVAKPTWMMRRGVEGGDNGEPVVNSTRKNLPMLHLKDTMRNNMIAVMGEFVGTFLFLFFSFAGTQVANTPKPVDGAPPNTMNLLYSSLAFGFSLMVNVWAFYRVTGGLFNPAVSLDTTRNPRMLLIPIARSLWPFAWSVDSPPSVDFVSSLHRLSVESPRPVSSALCSPAT